MKSVTAYLIAASIFAAVGVVALTASRLERELADAQEQTSTQQYAPGAAEPRRRGGPSPLRALGAERRRRHGREVRARQAALQYWQGDYAKVLPAQAEPVAAVDESNVALQLVVANAAFRTGTEGRDRSNRSRCRR